MKKFIQYFLEKAKHSKVEAGYVAHTVKGQACEDCTMWRPPHGCSAVAGTTWDSSQNLCTKKEGFMNQQVRPKADRAMPFSPSEEDDYQRI